MRRSARPRITFPATVVVFSWCARWMSPFFRSSASRRLPIGTPDLSTLIELGSVTLLAAAVQGTAGFGFSLLAVTFFLLILGSGDAIQLLIIINLAISLALAPKLWKTVHRGLWVRLAVGALVGLPLGLWTFRTADIDQLKVMAGLAILVFAVVAALRRGEVVPSSGPEPEFRTPSAVGAGLLAGGMTTALGMPGPPVVLYLAATGAGKDVTRSVTLTLFVVTYGASLLLQATTVGVSTGVWITGGLLIPIAAAGAAIGHALSYRVGETTFRNGVLALVGLTGAYVLLDTLFR